METKLLKKVEELLKDHYKIESLLQSIGWSVNLSNKTLTKDILQWVKKQLTE